MKTSITVLSGVVIGFLGAILITPMSGTELRSLLFSNESDDDDLSGHTFNINELVSPDSSSLDSIKEKIEHGF
ncbi:MAG: YtxH domain-containing protein [Chitinophagales bacterium]